MSLSESIAKNNSEEELKEISSLDDYSNEIVVALVGYAGAGCSTVALKIRAAFEEEHNYNVEHIKLSKLIEQASGLDFKIESVEDHKKGNTKIQRAIDLQNAGDQLREKHGNHAIAALAIKAIQQKRTREAGKEKCIYILDSVKHEAEVEILRKVYERSFRLIAVHCEREIRETRLISNVGGSGKFKGASRETVIQYMDRDERDKKLKHGQRVRDAFYLADFFLDNRIVDDPRINTDLSRFANLVLGSELLRPTRAEAGMYAAHTAALRSSCLSRQVGAALEAENGNIVSLGTNEVPKFGGGVYEHGVDGDNRCHVWEWNSENGITFRGCHNTRSKNILKNNLASWMESTYPNIILEQINEHIPKGMEKTVLSAVRSAFTNNSSLLSEAPEIGDIIEYSRSIHAEMDALFSAARSGTSTLKSTLYCTTFPCHNCARHLVTAGVNTVFYIEPYVKSRALDLHSDSITTDRSHADHPTGDAASTSGNNSHFDTTRHARMQVLPFTGVGPRMYEDYFAKRTSLKDDATGKFIMIPPGRPVSGVRLPELSAIENEVATLADKIHMESVEHAANDGVS